jgi:hypothetical protein
MWLFAFIFECLFFTVCGWIGHIVVKTVTLGRVDAPWGSGAESLLTEWVGVVFVLLVAGAIPWLLYR